LTLGTVVTGSGPHGGDPAAPRHAFDPLVITRLHAAPVYIMVIFTVVLLVVVRRINSSRAQRRAVWGFAAVLVFPALVGFYQHFNGLSIVAVLLHMLGPGLVAWMMTIVLDVFNAGYQTHPTDTEFSTVKATARL